MAGPYPSESRVLVVEGQDEKHVILHLCDRHPDFRVERAPGHSYGTLRYLAAPPFRVSDIGDGVSTLIKTMGTGIKAPGREVIGFVMDANGDLTQRWGEITMAFKTAKVDVELPTLPNPTGTIIEADERWPRIGVWLMPDNESEGELEDFVMKMIPHGDIVWPFAQSYIGGIPESQRKFGSSKTAKAQFYSWLATRREPVRMGAAIGAGDLEPVGVHCDGLFRWLIDLFR